MMLVHIGYMMGKILYIAGKTYCAYVMFIDYDIIL